MTSCDDVYNQYGGRSVGKATAEGVLAGLGAIAGLGGLFSPVDDSALKNIQQGFTDLKSKWDVIIQQYQGKLTALQAQFHQRQLDMLQEIESFHSDFTNEKLNETNLALSITFVALLIVIMYLMFL